MEGLAAGGAAEASGRLMVGDRLLPSSQVSKRGVLKCFRGGTSVGARFSVFFHSLTCVPLACLNFRRCDVPSASLVDRDRRDATRTSMHLNTFTSLSCLLRSDCDPRLVKIDVPLHPTNDELAA